MKWGLKLSGISGKITYLVIIPVLTVAVLITSMVIYGFKQINATQYTIDLLIENYDQYNQQLRRVQSDVIALENALRLMDQYQRELIVLENDTYLAKVTSARSTVMERSTAMAQSVRDLIEVFAKQTLIPLQEGKKRINYLRFSSSSVPRYIRFFTESQQRTIDLALAANYQRANYNYVFEESTRLQSLQSVITKITQVSTQLLESLNTEYRSTRKAQLTQLDQEVDTLFILLIIGVLLSVSVILAAALTFSLKNIVNPILDISKAAQALEQNRFKSNQLSTLRLRNDELGILGRSFTNMAAVVYSREQQLDALISERTRDLEQTSLKLSERNKEINEWVGRQRYLYHLLEAMQKVESGDFDVRLEVSGSDVYTSLYRGFNLMTEGLSEERRILEISSHLSVELQLDRLLERIIKATTELLNAERSTLFLFDERTNELWSTVAQGLKRQEIRIKADAGLAGAVFMSGEALNISDPYNDPRFNPEIDKNTGFKTTSILCMPLINYRTGLCIGVAQVLNKRGISSRFTKKDEDRLRAFTSQMAVSIENARLFDDILNIKNYNDNILKSINSGLITLDTEHAIVTANPAACHLLKMDKNALIRQPIDRIFTKANWLLDSISRVEDSRESDINLDVKLNVNQGGELSLNVNVVALSDVNNELIGSLIMLEDLSNEKRLKATMSRYMSKEVVDQLLASKESAMLGGATQKVSVLFSDIRNFTHLTETIGPKETVDLLNGYFSEMVDIIFRYQGILDKFIGDSIMALFGVPFVQPSDADRAVTVANEMQIAMAKINRKRREQNLPNIDIGIGISTGDVVTGNIGSAKRMEYTVIGDSVNLASRLESLNKTYGTRILISEDTAKELTIDCPLREIGLVRVRGKEAPVSVYEVLGYHTEISFPNMESILSTFSQGLGYYRQRKWDKASKTFAQALNYHPDDMPSQIYYRQCQIYEKSPPDKFWTGVL